MPDDLTVPIWERLSRDGAVGSLVSQYSGEPAIFSARPIPGAAVHPWVVIDRPTAGPEFTTDALAGLTQVRDVRVFDDADGSAARLDSLTDAVADSMTWTGTAEVGFVDWIAKSTTGIVQDTVFVLGRLVRVVFFRSTLSAGTIGFEDYEIPTEIPDGTITAYSTTRVYLSGSLLVWINGYRQRPGVDITQDADLMGYTTSGAIKTGSEIHHMYRYSS